VRYGKSSSGDMLCRHAYVCSGRASAPCVIFFDELDALAPRRGNDANVATFFVTVKRSDENRERVVNQLLTELDGLEERKQVFVVAATNRPGFDLAGLSDTADMIDPAMLRPGRLDKLLYVPLPNDAERLAILKTHSRSKPFSPEVDLTVVATRAKGFSGADLSAIIREAALLALVESMGTDGTPCIEQRHFLAAFDKVLPSVSPRDEAKYEHLRRSLRQTRGKMSDEEASREGHA
jgi:ribosome biogenesis ATPase